jgi:hypothetical protein
MPAQSASGLKLFRILGWVLAIFIPLYCLLLFPAFHELGSAIAGARQSYFSWPELALISLPLNLAAVGFGVAAHGLKRQHQWAANWFVASLLLLIVVDALMYFCYDLVKPWYRMDGMHVLGLGASSWRFLDSIYFSSAITGVIFLVLLVAFILWHFKLANRQQDKS